MDTFLPNDPFAAFGPSPDAIPSTDMLGLQPVQTVGPRDRKDKEAPKPDPKDVLADCEALLEEHSERLQQTEAMYRALAARRNDLDIGHFEGDEEDIENGEIEVFPLNSLRDEHEFNNGVIAQMESYIEHSSRERNDAEEVLAIEDACYYALDCFSRQHSRAFGGLLKRYKPSTLQYTGALVSMLTADPDNDTCGVRYSAIDPMTVLPIMEGANGLSDMFRVYQDTAASIIGNYNDPDDKVEKAVTKRLSKHSGSNRAVRNHLLEVKEYWNKDHVVVLVEDETILERQHGIGRVPFVVTLGAFELPMGVTTGNRAYHDSTSTEPGWHRDSHAASPDIAAQWRPWAYRHLPTHAIQEAVAGRTLTEFARSMFRPMIYEFDPYSRNQDTADLSQYARAVNKIPLGNKLSVLPTAPDAPTVAMLDQFLQGNANQGLWSQIRSGAIPPQTPSAALGSMFDLGGADRSALTDAISLHDRDVLEFYLELVRDWGPVMGKKGQRGALMIPSRDPQYASPFHRLTPEMIERAGTYLTVSMFHWRPDPAMAQYLSTMLSSGLSSPETAMRKSRYVPDPMREMQRIEDAMLRQEPVIATNLKIADLERQIEQAQAEGDDETTDRLMVAAMQLEFQNEQAIMAGAAPPPAGGSSGGAMGSVLGAGVPSPGGMSGPGAVGAPISQQGLSMPELGIGTGSQGGRPMGTTQPKTGMQNTTVTAPVR